MERLFENSSNHRSSRGNEAQISLFSDPRRGRSQSLPTNGVSERGCVRGGGISRSILDCREINALRLVPHPHTAALRFVNLMPPLLGDLDLLTSAATFQTGSEALSGQL
jgi:hypothetical protein